MNCLNQLSSHVSTKDSDLASLKVVGRPCSHSVLKCRGRDDMHWNRVFKTPEESGLERSVWEQLLPSVPWAAEPEEKALGSLLHTATGK